MKKKFFAVLFAALIAAVPVQASAEEATAVDNAAYHIYVSTPADANLQNGSKEYPFADISAAKDYVRTLDKSGGDIIVEIADGSYYLDEPLTFGVEDSGSENCTVRYVAAKGASPVISGGRRIQGEWRSEGGGIYSIEYNRNRKLRALYVNGERKYMTHNQIKGKGSDGELVIKAGQADWAWTSGTAYTGVLFGKNTIPLNTRNADDIELMTMTTWNTSIVCVESLEKAGSKICARLQMPYGAIAQTPGWGNAYQPKEMNIVYNVFEWLDEPGEFYFDKAEHRLYYYPEPSEDINTAEIIAPELETILDINGENIENRVRYLSFEGLTFAHSDWNLCEVDGSFGRATNQGACVLYNYDDVDWHSAVYRAYDLAPAAVQMSSACNISFCGNSVINTGNEGVSLINDVSDVKLSGNIIFDTGGSGLLIGHPQHMYIGDKNSGYGRFSEKEKYSADVEASCKRLDIDNNLIKSTSRLFWGDSGVMVFAAEEMNFTHNQVEDTTYSGLSLGWGWWNMNGSPESAVPGVPTETTKNNTVTANRFINTITVLADAGAIYTLGDMPGTIISSNYIRHIGTDGAEASYHIRGIHIDEGTKHVFGEKNVIDIDPDFTAVDCGNWGNKGSNEWRDNYSTSDSYKTTDDYEPDTVIESNHTVADANWQGEALETVNNSGIESDFTNILNSDFYKTQNYNLPYISEQSGLSAPQTAGICAGAVAAAAVVCALIIKLIKKKREKKNSEHCR